MQKRNDMKKNIIYIFAVLILAGLSSCEERITLDLGQWGDHAYIDNVQLFTLEADEHELHEFFTSGELTPARRRIFVSSGNAVIDSTSFTATMTVPATVDRSRTGIIIYHKAEMVEPLSNSPKAGIISDFSGSQYSYRLISADGTEHDWTVNIIEE
jgi:hypothetical protein